MLIIGFGCDAHHPNGSNQIVIGHNIQAPDNSHFAFGQSGNVVSNQFTANASFLGVPTSGLKRTSQMTPWVCHLSTI